METTKAERIRLGLFLLLCFVGIVGFVGYLIGEKIHNQKVTYYTIFSESVQGLSVDARVMLNGIDVGHVRKILIDPKNLNNVMVWFEVSPETPIKAGTQVQMTSGISLTGNRYLILNGGDAAEENLPDGSFVQAGVNRISEITGQAENLVARIEMLLDNLNNVLSEKNAKKISRTLSNFEEASAGTKTMMAIGNALLNNGNRLVKSMEAPVAKLDTSMGSLKRITAELDESHLAIEVKNTLDQIQAKMAALDTKQMNDDLVKTLHSLEAMSRRVDVFLYKNQTNFADALKQLNAILENLNDFSQKIKNQPSSLIRSPKASDREK